jgi:hypothetical protein
MMMLFAPAARGASCKVFGQMLRKYLHHNGGCRVFVIRHYAASEAVVTGLSRTINREVRCTQQQQRKLQTHGAKLQSK